MPADKETKPRYELRPRDQRGYYVLLCEGKHCLAAICIKKPRGVLDAQLILLAMNSHKDLLAICEASAKRFRLQSNGDVADQIEASIAKIEQESTL